MIDVLVGVVHAEWLVDGGALIHEGNGAAGVGRDVADGEQSGGRGGGTRDVSNNVPSPSHINPSPVQFYHIGTVLA